MIRTVQKNPRVCKMFVRNSGAGNGCANFMGTWKNCVLSAGKPPVHKIPRFRGGGYFGVWGGGGSADFIFMGARIFLNCLKIASDLRFAIRRMLFAFHPWFETSLTDRCLLSTSVLLGSTSLTPPDPTPLQGTSHWDRGERLRDTATSTRQSKQPPEMAQGSTWELPNPLKRHLGASDESIWGERERRDTER